MSWPYEITLLDYARYINQMQNLCQSVYPDLSAPNQLLNSLALNYYNTAQNFSIFPTNCPTVETNNFGLLTNQIVQSADANNSLNEEEEIRDQRSERNSQHSANQSSFLFEQVRMVRFRRRRIVKKPKNTISHNSSLRNDTKNIPKNYGKAMLAYIQKNTREAKQLLSAHDVDYLEFMMVLKSFKSKINTIHDLRQMWGESNKEDKVKKCLRILCYHFMRKKCIPYIFNSRVKNFHTHIKYRKKIMQGIQNPENFTKIKEF